MEVGADGATHIRVSCFQAESKEVVMRGWREWAAEMEFLGATLQRHHWQCPDYTMNIFMAFKAVAAGVVWEDEIV